MLSYFLPPTLLGKRLYAEKSLGISIEQGIVRGVVVEVTRFRTILHNALEEEFKTFVPSGKEFGFDPENLQQALVKLVADAGKVDIITICLPSRLAVFKELLLPFADPDKVRLVLGYEAEQLLPFEAQDASLAFLTSQVFLEGKAKTVVAAMRDVDLAKFAKMLRPDSMQPQAVLLDAVALYGFTLQVPDYAQVDHVTLIIDFAPTSITLTLIEKMALRQVRSFDFGLQGFVQACAKAAGMTEKAVREEFCINGFKHLPEKELQEAVKIELSGLLDKLSFVIDSFFLSLPPESKIGKILIFEGQLGFKDLDVACQQFFNAPCEMLSVTAWAKAQNLRCKVSLEGTEHSRFAKALATALPSSTIQTFNLGQKTFLHPGKPFLVRQACLALLLVTLSLGYVVVNYSLRSSKLSGKIKAKEKELVAQLKPLLPADVRIAKNPRLNRLMQDVVQAVEKQEALHAGYGLGIPQVLPLLFELTRHLDRQRFGILIQEMHLQPKSSGRYKLVVSGTQDPSKAASKSDTLDQMVAQLQNSALLVLDRPVEIASTDRPNVSKFTLTLEAKHA